MPTSRPVPVSSPTMPNAEHSTSTNISGQTNNITTTEQASPLQKRINKLTKALQCSKRANPGSTLSKLIGRSALQRSNSLERLALSENKGFLLDEKKNVYGATTANTGEEDQAVKAMSLGQNLVSTSIREMLNNIALKLAANDYPCLKEILVIMNHYTISHHEFNAENSRDGALVFSMPEREVESIESELCGSSKDWHCVEAEKAISDFLTGIEVLHELGFVPIDYKNNVFVDRTSVDQKRVVLLDFEQYETVPGSKASDYIQLAAQELQEQLKLSKQLVKRHKLKEINHRIKQVVDENFNDAQLIKAANKRQMCSEHYQRLYDQVVNYLNKVLGGKKSNSTKLHRAIMSKSFNEKKFLA